MYGDWTSHTATDRHMDIATTRLTRPESVKSMNGCNLLEKAGNGCNVWERLEWLEIGCKWLEMAGNSWNCRKWLYITVNGYTWLKIT